MGHRSFSTEPPPWVQATPLVRAARVRQARRRESVDVLGVKPRYEAMAQVETLLRAEMRAKGQVESGGQPSLAQVKAYAADSQSDAAKQYRGLLADEAAYQQQIARWQAAIKEESQAIDTVMGEKGANANWREEQADTLGLRLFLQWGGRAEDFFNALVRTLSRKDPELVDYIGDLFKSDDLSAVPAPPRGDERHPSPKWRVYNLLVRELHLRYPNEYLKLLSQPLPPALRGAMA